MVPISVSQLPWYWSSLTHGLVAHTCAARTLVRICPMQLHAAPQTYPDLPDRVGDRKVHTCNGRGVISRHHFRGEAGSDGGTRMPPTHLAD